MKCSYAPYHSLLSGETFSNAMSLPLREASIGTSRVDTLASLCKGESVLHVGCCDHLPLIEEKRSRGEWLHERLLEVASSCTGIDIDVEALSYLRDTLGIKDIVEADISGPPIAEISDKRFDTMLLGEVVEHLDDPGPFLRAIHSNYASQAGRLLVTVPSFTGFATIRGVFRGRELVNSDHRYWFSPYTIGRLLSGAGFTPVSYALCRYTRTATSLKGVARSSVENLFPQMKPCVIVEARFNP